MLSFCFVPGNSSMAAHIALLNVGVPFLSRPPAFAKPEYRKPGFLAFNPERKVSTLSIDGRIFNEVVCNDLSQSG
jgi:glutathione S-transferase